MWTILVIISVWYRWKRSSLRFRDFCRKNVTCIWHKSGLFGYNVHYFEKHIFFKENLYKIIHHRLSSLPDELGELCALKSLSAVGNNITRLPPSLTNLTNLEELLLDENQLFQFPEGFGRLCSLKVIRLCGKTLFYVWCDNAVKLSFVVLKAILLCLLRGITQRGICGKWGSFWVHFKRPWVMKPSIY